MEETKEANVFTYTMWGGLYLGLIYIARNLAETLIYSHIVSFGGALLLFLLSIGTFAITLYMVINGTNKYKREVLKENVNYFKVLNYGFYLFFFASIIYAVYLYIFLVVINPEALITQQNFYNSILTQGEQMADDANRMAFSELKKYLNDNFTTLLKMSPRDITMNSLFGETSYGFFFCLVTSIFLNKKKQNPKSTNIIVVEKK